MKQCVCKGWHFSWPRIIQFKRNRIRLDTTLSFENNFAYDLPGNDPDQKDWIKIDGLYFFPSIWKIFSTRYVTILLGARFNPKNDTIDLVPYYHDGSSDFIFNKKDIVNIHLNSTIHLSILIDSKNNESTLELHSEKSKMLYQDRKVQSIRFFRRFKTRFPKYSNRINLYFGGNEKAPSKVCVYKN